MRKIFVEQLTKEMEENSNIYFLTGDLGFNALEPLQKQFPDRFINVGIAEANMIGVAAGLALEGKKVITYSIASFITMRAYEQIRTDVCYHNLDVKIVGTGGGYNYPTHGATHHTVEDIAIMSALPKMKVICPAHTWEVYEATKAILKDTGPVYLRLSRNPEDLDIIRQKNFKIGKGFVVKDGTDVVICSTGNMLDVALETARSFEKNTKKSVRVLSFPTVKPFDQKLLLESIKSAKAIFSIEEHSTHGGLGSKIAQTLSNANSKKIIFYSFGLPDYFIKDVGNRNFLLKKAGLDVPTILKTIYKKITS
jgi:transketolase